MTFAKKKHTRCEDCGFRIKGPRHIYGAHHRLQYGERRYVRPPKTDRRAKKK